MKTAIPRFHGTLLRRERLFSLLNTQRLPCVLVSAPPGYGKSLLISSWLDYSGEKAAWLSLDEQDNDPPRFFSYLLEVTKDAFPGDGKALRDLSELPQIPAIRELIIHFISTWEEDRGGRILVLDDYHLITNPAIHDAVEFLLNHLPEGLRVFIITRSDPPFPMARLRTHRRLFELREKDLAFDIHEVKKFFSGQGLTGMGDRAIERIHGKTEGWAAGLQLAALRLQTEEHIDAFLNDFDATGRYVADFLIEEILDCIPPEMYSFLLTCSIPPFLTPSLCRFLTGDPSASETLREAERRNLFILRVGPDRFRFHSLFLDLLRNRFAAEYGGDTESVRSRTLEWLKQNGNMEEALVFAFREGRIEEAAELMEQIAASIWDHRIRLNLDSWLRGTIGLELSRYPELSLYLARMHLLRGEDGAAGTYIDAVEQSLEDRRPELIDAARLRGRCSLLRASLCVFRGDTAGIRMHSERALEFLDSRDAGWRSIASSSVAVARMWEGPGYLDEAILFFDRACDEGRQTGNTYAFLSTLFQKAIALKMLGRIDEALVLQEFLTGELEKPGNGYPGLLGDVYAELGDIRQEKGEISEAGDIVGRGLDLCLDVEDPMKLWWSRYQYARVSFFAGDREETERQLNSLESLENTVSLPGWFISMSAALRFRMLLEEPEKARRWLHRRGLDRTCPFSAIREREFIELGRFSLVGEDGYDESLLYLRSLEAYLRPTGRIPHLLEVLLLETGLHLAAGREPAAEESLLQALESAKGGIYVRTFTSGGEKLGSFLERIARDRPCLVPDEYLPFSRDGGGETGHLRPHPDDLSDREKEVLLLMARGLSNMDISERLFISLNTTKTHLKNINMKLYTTNRTQAIARARETGILTG